MEILTLRDVADDTWAAAEAAADAIASAIAAADDGDAAGMDMSIVEAFMASTIDLQEGFRIAEPLSYKNLVEMTLRVISTKMDSAEGAVPNPHAVVEIDQGSFSGIKLYVIPEKHCFPTQYWVGKIAYGSCSVCDTLSSLQEEDNKETRVHGYWTLALHFVQRLKRV